jgi:hypothetical protein
MGWAVISEQPLEENISTRERVREREREEGESTIQLDEITVRGVS